MIFNEIWNHIDTKVYIVKKKIADYMSLYPDPSDLWIQQPPANDAMSCILDILALEFVLPGTRTRHQTYDQRERMSRLIQRFRRQGYWGVVEEMIQQPQGLIFQIQVLLKHFSPEDIFGNLVPKLKRRLSSIRPTSKNKKLLIQAQKFVRPRIRRRGYNDHGSLRLNHTKLPWNAYAEPELPKEPEVSFYAPRPYQWIPLRM